jgi:hypothetical protein
MDLSKYINFVQCLSKQITRRFNLLGLMDPGEKIPKKNLMNRLLVLIRTFFVDFLITPS